MTMSETEEPKKTRTRRGPLSYAAVEEETRQRLYAAKRRDLEKACSMMQDAGDLLLRASVLLESVAMKGEATAVKEVVQRAAALGLKLAQATDGEQATP